jgi:hypothetical protein
MKNVIVFIIACLGMITGRLVAQEMSDKEKMKVFESWAGHWQGEGSMQMGPGEPHKSNVDEHIQLKLDGMVVLVEGVGKAKDPSGNEMVVHHALAILSYDKITNQYKFRSHLKDGRSTDAWFNVVKENNYQWGFESKQGKMRYTIVIDPAAKTWNEIGEWSSDGTTWRKVFEMNLKKTVN